MRKDNDSVYKTQAENMNLRKNLLFDNDIFDRNIFRSSLNEDLKKLKNNQPEDTQDVFENELEDDCIENYIKNKGQILHHENNNTLWMSLKNYVGQSSLTKKIDIVLH